MATIKITYDLSENGRRASLLAGGDGREHQVVEVPATPELLAIAHIATDGSAAYSLAPGLPGRGSIDYDAPIADPATIAVAHAAAQIAAKAQEEQQREADRRAVLQLRQSRMARRPRTTRAARAGFDRAPTIRAVIPLVEPPMPRRLNEEDSHHDH
jgi:hypothetical protein